MAAIAQNSSQNGVNSGIDKRLSVGHTCEFDPFDYGTDYHGHIITTCQICGRCENRGFFRCVGNLPSVENWRMKSVSFTGLGKFLSTLKTTWQENVLLKFTNC